MEGSAFIKGGKYEYFKTNKYIMLLVTEISK